MESDDPFYDKMPAVVAERAIAHARETYSDLRDLERRAYQANVEYGKWLVASLLAIHLGSVLIISQVPEQATQLFIELGAYHVGGIAFAMACGFFAWLNFAYLAREISETVTPAMLYRSDEWPEFQNRPRNPVGATYWMALCSGSISLWLFIASGVRALEIVGN